jgi:hypothetical protein
MVEGQLAEEESSDSDFDPNKVHDSDGELEDNEEGEEEQNLEEGEDAFDCDEDENVIDRKSKRGKLIRNNQVIEESVTICEIDKSRIMTSGGEEMEEEDKEEMYDTVNINALNSALSSANHSI